MLNFEAEGSDRNVNVGQWRESAFGGGETINAGTVDSESYSIMGTASSDCHVSGPSQVQITGQCGDGVTITLTAGPLTGTFTGSVRCDIGQGGDSDSGGIPDSQDTGPTIANPGQEDTDRDDIRDADDDTSPAPVQPEEPPVKPGQPPRGAPITPPDR
jgi:hypothetical protein